MKRFDGVDRVARGVANAVTLISSEKATGGLLIRLTLDPASKTLAIREDETKTGRGVILCPPQLRVQAPLTLIRHFEKNISSGRAKFSQSDFSYKSHAEGRGDIIPPTERPDSSARGRSI